MKRRLRRKVFTLALGLLLIMMSAAMAETLEDARAAAQALVGDQAALVESEADDGLYEFTFRDDAARYEVDIRASDGAVIEFETRYSNVPKATAATLTEAEARAKAMAHFPDAAVSLAIAERDDGGAVYEVFLTTDGAPATLTINAETGDMLSIERYPAAAGALTADQIAQTVGTPISDLELTWDDASYYYEGDTPTHEFKIDAFTGEVREMERED